MDRKTNWRIELASIVVFFAVVVGGIFHQPAIWGLGFCFAVGSIVFALMRKR
jgi:hypothetical protein